jgi:hypothetical protein
MTNQEITKALLSLCPEADWSLTGDDYENIIWNSQTIKPTLAELEAEITALPSKEAALKNAHETARKAILDRLGLTLDEAKILLG